MKKEADSLSRLIWRVFLLLLLVALADLAASAGCRRAYFHGASNGPHGLFSQRFEGSRWAGEPIRTHLEQRTAFDQAQHADFPPSAFSLRLTGFLTLSWPGLYTVGVESDDDSRLFLDGVMVVDNSGEHPMRRRTTRLWMGPGRHLIEVEYANRGGSAGLVILCGNPFGPARQVDGHHLLPSGRPFSRAQASTWGWDIRHLMLLLHAFLALLFAVGLYALCRPRSLAMLWARLRVEVAACRRQSLVAALMGALQRSPTRLFPLTHWRETALVGLVSLGLALVFAYPILTDFTMWGGHDWDQHMFFLEAPRKTILEFGQIPLWNPWYCGGTVLLANPQSRFLTPSYLLILWLGVEPGIKLTIILNLALGMWGFWRLSRHWGLNRLAAWLPGSLYFLGGMFTNTIPAGMTWILSLTYLPWAALFLLRGLNDTRSLVLSGGALAFMFLEGGAYPLVISLLLLGLLAFSRLGEVGWRRVTVGLMLVLACMIAMGAVKFLPAYAFQSEHPRPMFDPSGYSPALLLGALVHPSQNVNHFLPEFLWGMPTEGSGILAQYGWDENSLFIGWTAFGLCLLGVLVGLKRQWFLVVGVGLLVWVSLGSGANPSLWDFLHHYPPFDSMRVAQRFRLAYLACFALWAGGGLQWLYHLVDRKFGFSRAAGILQIALLMVCLSELWLMAHPLYSQTFRTPPVQVPSVAEFVQIRRLPDYDQHGWTSSPPKDLYSTSLLPAIRGGLGIVEADESANVPRLAVPRESANYSGEVHLAGMAGTARIVAWSPNRLEVDMQAQGQGWLVLNQNYYPGWRVQGRGEMEERDGLLCAAVGPDDRHLSLYYCPTTFLIGCSLSLATLLVLIFYFPLGAPEVKPGVGKEG